MSGKMTACPAPGALVPVLALLALLLLCSGCAEMGGRGLLAEYAPYHPRNNPGYVAQWQAPAQPPRATVARTSVAPVDRTTTGLDYRRQQAEVACWTAAERERRIKTYLREHPESGYRRAREETQARLQEARRRLADYRESQDVLGGRDFSRDYESRLREGVSKEERELARIDGLIVDAILGDQAAAAARVGGATPEERGRLERAGVNAGRAAGESRRRADEAFRSVGW